MFEEYGPNKRKVETEIQTNNKEYQSRNSDTKERIGRTSHLEAGKLPGENL